MISYVSLVDGNILLLLLYVIEIMKCGHPDTINMDNWDLAIQKIAMYFKKLICLEKKQKK